MEDHAIPSRHDRLHVDSLPPHAAAYSRVRPHASHVDQHGLRRDEILVHLVSHYCYDHFGWVAPVRRATRVQKFLLSVLLDLRHRHGQLQFEHFRAFVLGGRCWRMLYHHLRHN